MTWTTFSALTTATTDQLDGNFAILSGLTPIPCTVAGTNTLTLTSVAGATTIAAYANYMRFTGIAANTNGGAVTAQFGSLAALNVYKDTPAGPVALVGNEIVQFNEFTLVYDLALNTGAGGFHLKTGGTELVGQTVTMGTLKLSDGMSITNNATIPGLANIGTLTVSGSASLVNLFVGASAALITRSLSSTTTATMTGVNSGQTSVTLAFAGVSVSDFIGANAIVGNRAVNMQAFVIAAGTVAVNYAAFGTIGPYMATLRLTAVGYT